MCVSMFLHIGSQRVWMKERTVYEVVPGWVLLDLKYERSGD